MSEINFKMPNCNDPAYSVIMMKRGKQRKFSHRHIILEVLTALGDQTPTRDQLQKLVKIQRKRFIEVLKTMMGGREVERIGTGTKNDPYLYRLFKFYQETKRKNHFW